jgi:hypothetical protein
MGRAMGATIDVSGEIMGVRSRSHGGGRRLGMGTRTTAECWVEQRGQVHLGRQYRKSVQHTGIGK